MRQGDKFVTTYFNELKNLWEDLTDNGSRNCLHCSFPCITSNQPQTILSSPK